MRSRPFLTVVSLLAITVCLLALGPAWDFEHARAGDKPRELRASKATYGVGMIAWAGKGPEAWRWRLIVERRTLKRQANFLGRELREARRELRKRYEPSFEHYFTIAALTYGVDRAMLERKGRCESVHFTDFYNETPIYNGEHAQGVMGFIPSTFNSTPFAGLDVRYDHLANIMAGAWMHDVGRGGEWACR